MLDIMENLPAALAGSVAAACLVSSPLFRARRAVLTMQLAAGLSFATYYALLGTPVASGVNVLGAVQTTAAIFAGRSLALNRIGYALIPLMIAVGFNFWSGPISALSVAAMTLLALGRMQESQKIMRALLLAGGGFWVAHDLLAEAWIALAADVGTLITGLAAFAALFISVRVEWREREPATMVVFSDRAPAQAEKPRDKPEPVDKIAA